MKIRVTFKDPGAGDAVEEAVRSSVQAQGLTDQDEVDAVYDASLEKTREKLRRWVEFGEYVTVEFDLDADTARVMPKGG